GFSEKTQLYTGTILPTTERSPDERFYGEAGIGFNRLLLLFRVDVSARFTQRSTPQVVFTLSAATF
ncbi:MAG TPA: hypothetical protein PLI74_10465, partial [Candidatus Kapabacteria bacterium]|nr:hypothetical protein [Candidatus Kapabacteria bacterium]